MKRGFLNRSICIIFSLLIVARITNAEDVSAAFNEANKFYEQGKFVDAATRYEKIIQSGSISAPLFFNLGNAHLKSGKIGRAIVSYHKAERLSPRDVEIRSNLQFARNLAGGGAAPRQTFWENWLRRLTVNEWTVLTSVVFSLWFFVLAIRQWRDDWKNSFRGLVASLGILTMLLIVFLVVTIRQESTPFSGVIVPEAVVRLGTFEESPSAFTLHDGAEVKVLNRKDDWLQIEDQARRTGWMLEKQLMSLNAPKH
jgi:hypothetical protein